MNRGFYRRLAASNMKKNYRITVPWLLTGVFLVMMFYMIATLAWNPQLVKATHTVASLTMMNLVRNVVGVFAVILLFYADSFLMKQRRKELGLYNMLGMEKRHIGRMLFWETLYAWAAATAAGIGCGMMFSKLLFMILGKIFHMDFGMGFYISVRSLGVTIVLFAGIYLFSYVLHLIQLKVTRPIELLRSTQEGEREPRTKWVLAILGAAALGFGYYLSLSLKNPIDAISVLFFAVLLVIAGTYLLFVAGSVAILKLLRKNKSYYYRTRHFTAVSGLIWRMKRNAVGLASICILSTAVLVVVSVTFSLYRGVEHGMDSELLRNSIFRAYCPTQEQADQAQSDIEDEIKRLGIETANETDYTWMATGAILDGTEFKLHFLDYGLGTDAVQLEFLSAKDYQKLTGQEVRLADHHVLFYHSRGKQMDHFSYLDETWTVDGTAVNEGIPGNADIIPYCIVILPDWQTFCEVWADTNAGMRELYGQDFADTPVKFVREIHTDIKGSERTQIDGCGQIADALSAKYAQDNEISFYIRSRADMLEHAYQFYGSFLFIGIFLAVVFLVGTVLIIYYKQMSEGYEDQRRFWIMQNVGMSRAEVRQSIRSQVLTLFYLPLVTAAVHCFVAFPLLKGLMDCSNGVDTSCFLPCLVVTLLIFAIIYALVYSMTAKVYYKIVTAKQQRGLK